METTVEETQYYAVDPIFEDSHFNCGPASGSRLEPADAMLNKPLVSSVGNDIPKTASTPLLITAQISPNETGNFTLCRFSVSKGSSSKIAGDILDQSVDPLPIDHMDFPQSTPVSGTTPDLPDCHAGAKDSKDTCEISNECPLSQSTPCPFTDADLTTVEAYPTLTEQISEIQTVNSDLASPPSTETPTKSDPDALEIHGSGTSDSGDDSSFANMTTNSSSSSSECSEQTSVASSPTASPARAKGEQIPYIDVGQTDILVKVPDMMSSIMSSKPVVNPHYFSAKLKIDS